MFTIYVGMALKGAPEEFRTDFQRELKSKLRKVNNVEVLDFFWEAKGRNPEDNIEVYLWDKERTENADLCVFVADHASTGMGQEFEIRMQTGKSAAAFVHATNDSVSNMFLGACEVHKVPVVRYRSVDDIVAYVASYILVKENK